ncbi:MAG: hypothetical protein SF339_18325 [Blastocatellia bacterium]|nr:hypothetical protein [Blastocatellia bacterium]
MSDLLSLNETHHFIRSTRADFDRLATELRDIPTAIEAAKRDGDAAQIRRLKSRETELHGLILDEAGRARGVLFDRQQSELKPRDARRAELTSAADLARQTLADIEADARRRIEAARAAVDAADKTLNDFNSERQSAAAEVAKAMDELTAAVAKSADFV